MIEIRHKKLLSQFALVAALSLSVNATQAGETIKIGGMAPLSSPGSYQQGPELVLGLEWAVADFNAAGGVLGKQIELIVYDTQGRPPTIVGRISGIENSVTAPAVSAYNAYPPSM